MGFKQRERKRKRKAAHTQAQAQGRDSGSSSSKWWLTVVTRKGCCANPECPRILPVGAECVYRHVPREMLCVDCGESLPWRPSVRWERERSQNRNNTRRHRA